MKKLLAVMMLMPMVALADEETNSFRSQRRPNPLGNRAGRDAGIVECQTSVNGHTWSYFVENGEATIGSWRRLLGCRKADLPKPSGDVEIPSKLGDATVTGIGEWAFFGCSGLKTVTIPSGVTRIGREAFQNCGGLTAVTLPQSVTSIGSGAFQNCNGLTSVTIPGSVTNVGAYAFHRCMGLMAVTIQDGVTSIGDGAFEDCKGLTSVTIPGSVTDVGKYAFKDCRRLTAVTIPNGVASIGDRAFEDCIGLMAVTIQNGVKSIGDHAFDFCKGLTSVTIPGSVTNVGAYAFNCCMGLTAVTIQNGVKSIEHGAFGDCGRLVSVTIPASVTSIGGSAFSRCHKLMEINVAEDNQMYASVGGVLYTKDMGTLVACPGGLASVTIQTNVTSIGYSAFNSCSNLTSVTIPENVTNIVDSAFQGCSSLVNVTMRGEYVGMDYRHRRAGAMFADCEKLMAIHVPSNSPSWAGKTTWQGIPLVFHVEGYDWQEGKTTVDGYTWSYLVKGSEATIVAATNGNCHCAVSPNPTGRIVIPSRLDGARVAKIGRKAFQGCAGLTQVTIPSTIRTIEEEAFFGCSGLTAVSIPSGVTSIGLRAFSGCRGLKTIFLPSSVTSMGGFADCDALTSFEVDEGNPRYRSINGMLCTKDGRTLISGVNGDVTIPSNVTYIADSAFVGRGGLKTVTIPLGLTRIGRDAFQNCGGLTAVTMPPSVTSIGGYAFDGCSNLTTVTIPQGMTNIGMYAFLGCSGLKAVSIPAGIKSINACAFLGCSKLKTVTISASVTCIGRKFGRGAFAECSALEAFVVDEANPKYCSVNGLLCSKDGRTLIDGVNGDVSIPDGVTSIGEGAFVGRGGLKSVTIPASVTKIAGDVEVKRGVEMRERDAFEKCTGLRSFVVDEANPKYRSINGLLCSKDGKILIFGVNGDVTIPEGVTYINAFAFSGCSGLTSVTIPSSVTNIGRHAFARCGLKSFAVDKANTVYSSVAGLLCTKDGRTLICGVNGDVTIPPGVTSIGEWSFSGCSGLTSVSIPNSVMSIGSHAFLNCRELRSMTLPSCVTNVDVQAFGGCPNLKSVDIVREGKVESVPLDELVKQWAKQRELVRPRLRRSTSPSASAEGTRNQPQGGQTATGRRMGSLRERRALRDKQREDAAKAAEAAKQKDADAAKKAEGGR